MSNDSADREINKGAEKAGQRPEDDSARVEAKLPTLSGEPIAKTAETAVKILGAEKFIENYSHLIFEKLEECDKYAQSADFNGDLVFIALSLPIINGIIHVASNSAALIAARDWVVSKWKDNKDPDPVSILSALTLVYVVAKGWRAFQEDQERREVWRRILGRMERLNGQEG